jgi:hypothetical protein
MTSFSHDAPPLHAPWSEDVCVFVLCADWCTQCRAFQPVADGLAGAGLRWIDIEDEGLDADELGLTAFPGVAIFRPAGVLRYLGPVRADREGFLAAVRQLSRLAERTVPEALRPSLTTPNTRSLPSGAAAPT